MHVTTVHGKPGCDFIAYLAEETARKLDAGANPSDMLAIAPTRQALADLEQALAARGVAHAGGMRATTPELAARERLLETGTCPRIVTPGELGLVVERARDAGMTGAEAVRAIDRRATLLAQALPEGAAFDTCGDPETGEGVLEDFEEFDLAMWGDLPGLALNRLGVDALHEMGGQARTVFVLDAQDLSPAALTIAGTLAEEEVVLCDAPDLAWGPADRLRGNRRPAEALIRALGELGARGGEAVETGAARLCDGRAPQTARVLWETVDEELSGVAAYVWKVLHANLELEPRDVGVIVPDDRWAATLESNLRKDGIASARLWSRGPLDMSPHAGISRDEYEAYLRVLLAAVPSDGFAQAAADMLGYETASVASMATGLVDATGFSLAKAATSSLEAPYVEGLLTRHPETTASSALHDLLPEILDPSFDTNPRAVRICTPRHANRLRTRIVIGAGLSQGFSEGAATSRSRANSLRKAISSADYALLSRPRSAEVQAAGKRGFSADVNAARSVVRAGGTTIRLAPGHGYNEYADGGAPLIGEQLLAGIL